MDTLLLINELSSLPVEDRALVAESMLLSLNKPETEIDCKWGIVAQKRLDDLRRGKVQPIDGDSVFNAIWQRFEK
jgi:hypothetical protein